MTMPFADFAARGSIAADEVLMLRRAVWADGAISLDEAEALIALNARINQPSPEWRDFFVEALTVLLTEQAEPRGYISSDQADWLVTRLGLSAPGAPVIELLVHLSERAQSVPPILRAFALERIETAIVERDADGQARVTADEVRWLRRLIFAPGSDGPACVSQAEAEALFRIKDLTLAADNVPEWKQLFVQGVANYLQGLAGAQALSAEREAELERFIASPEPGLGSYLARATSGAANPLAGLRLAFAPSAVPTRNWQNEAASAAEVTGSENAWLKREVEADGQSDPYEEALAAFLRQG